MTRTLGIIGHSERGPVDEALLIQRWGQFIIKFGSFSKAKTLAHGVQGFFENGGKRCYVINVSEDEEGKLDIETGLKAFDKIDEIEFIAAPGQTDEDSHKLILDHCEKHNRFAILDLIGEIEEEEEQEVKKEEAEGETEADGSETEEETEVEEEEEEEEEKPKGLDALPELEDTDHGIYIFPWCLIKDPLGKHETLQESYINIPVSAHIAGLYATAEDDSRKLPHDKKIHGTVSLTYKATDKEQRMLNEKGIECLRFHPKELIAIGSHDRFYDSTI